MRWLVTTLLVIAMFCFGVGVYHAAGLLKASHAGVQRPTQVSAPSLPGTMYLVQGGAIYRLRNGQFTQITADDGWVQVAVNAAGSQLAAVERHTNYSDLYLLSTGGRVIAQLTHNGPGSRPENNHWSFYPRFSPDGSTLFYDYDPKDPFNTYRVDLAIYSSPSNPGSSSSVKWTEPNQYTGGDVDPQPLSAGSLVYSKFSIDTSFKVASQVWFQARPGSAGVALTDPADGCGQPAVSHDGTMIAMVCTKGSNQTSELDVATFDPTARSLGSITTLVPSGTMASPTFSPDGKTIAYLAPAVAGGSFQLWTVAPAPGSSPRELTTDLGLDSLSAPAWAA